MSDRRDPVPDDKHPPSVLGGVAVEVEPVAAAAVEVASRGINWGVWFAFAIAALAAVKRSSFVVSGSMVFEVISLADELLGIAAALFVREGIRYARKRR